jgi:hypothetical protein
MFSAGKIVNSIAHVGFYFRLSVTGSLSKLLALSGIGLMRVIIHTNNMHSLFFTFCLFLSFTVMPYRIIYAVKPVSQLFHDHIAGFHAK